MLFVLLLLLKPVRNSVICTEIATVVCRPPLSPLSRRWDGGYFRLISPKAFNCYYFVLRGKLERICISEPDERSWIFFLLVTLL